MTSKSLQIDPSWKNILKDEFNRPYFNSLLSFVYDEYENKTIYPKKEEVFRAFKMCPFNKVKVVILGQDPYHGIDQANGLAFAVHAGVRIPPSLKNIFKEIESDTGIKPEADGDLSRFAKQGVLLLNATLTVQVSNPASHQGKGWEQFTDAVIKKLSENCKNLVFILWGNYAKHKGSLIDRTKHLVLESPHPSPFSAYTGFFGCKHFSKTNEYLKSCSKEEVDWR